MGPLNTPAHLIVGAAALARPGQSKVTAAALAGSLLPDISLYLLAIHSLFILDIPSNVVFGELYFSEAWQAVFAVDNSVFVWLAIALAGAVSRLPWMLTLGIAGLLHIATDFPLHHDDGRQHFWPLSEWVFESPLSYWDPGHYGNIIGPIEAAACFFLSIFLWTRFRSWISRGLIVAAASMEIVPAIYWGLAF
ncbi:MAG: cobalamin biosynthesis protein CobQ [Albidovulum sp.]|nr:cobalamin biosynthesis protein CobQ [Albidovulum sp.]